MRASKGRDRYLQRQKVLEHQIVGDRYQSDFSFVFRRISGDKFVRDRPTKLPCTREICENYHVMVDSFSSLVDGKALCCLVDYYFRNELHDDCFCKEAQDNNGKESVIISTDNTVVLRNFKLVQRVAKALGNFPEVLQISDILDQDIACNERSVIILLSFLSSQLIGRKNLDQLNLTKLVGWSHWSPDMKPGATAHASDHASNSDLLNVFSSQETHIFSFAERVDQVQLNANTFPDAVPKIKVIQAWWRALAKRKEYLKIKFAASIIQGNVRCQLAHKHINERRREMAAKVIQSHFRGSIEHHSFIKMKAAASFLQIVIRAWLKVVSKKSCSKFCQNYLGHLTSGGETSGIFERYLKCMIERRNFIRMQKSVLFIQRTARTWISQRRQMEKIEKLLREKKLLENLIEAEVNQCFAVTKIQSCWRGCLMRKDFLCQRTAIIIIQSWLRSLQYLKEFKKYKSAAIEIQRCARGMIARTRLLGDPYLCVSHLDNHSQDHSSSRCTKQVEVKHLQHSVLKLQRWWKRVLASRLRTRATIIIQSHTRGWITRREFQRERHHIVVIQSYWKGYLARKDHQELRDQLLDLRHRMQKSAVNVDNGMRLINRLVAALDELLSYKRLTSTLRTCQTLDMATEHSQKCCETLVAAGAIDTLLKLIRTVSRSIPDQEVSKHSLSTLRNLARYRHLVEMLIDTHGSVEIIFRELLRNKEMYFIAADLLKKLCLLKKGVEALRNCPLLVKRLRNLVQDLERKASMGKRNARLCAATYDFEQRLRVASELFQLVMKAMKA